MEIVGIPKNLKGEDFEVAVLNVLEVARVPIEKRDFDAVHRLRNTRVVIAKVIPRHAIAILRNKKKLEELSQETKKNWRVKKFTLINLWWILR